MLEEFFARRNFLGWRKRIPCDNREHEVVRRGKAI
jgi:hypothetical protein